MYDVSLTEAAKIVFEICLAIEFLHSDGIAHRDLKVLPYCCLDQILTQP